jgi:MFS family permease
MVPGLGQAFRGPSIPPWHDAAMDQPRPPIAPLLAGYWSFGQFWGVWVILVLEFQREHGISDSHLGVLYTLLSVVAVAAMLVLAPRLQPLPLRSTVPLGLLMMAVATFAMGFLPTDVVVVGFLLLGIGNGLVDVYLNVAAQRAEVAWQRPVLQWLHACYALGGLTGAAVAGLIGVLKLDFRIGFAYATVALLLSTAWNARTASVEPGGEGADTAFSISPLFRSPGLWVPALVVLFAFLVEGSMDTWSGLYVRVQLNGTAGIAAWAFVAFSGAVFLGRMFAGRVLFGLGSRMTILLSGAGSAVGGAIAVATDKPWLVGVAFLFLGFSISAAAPAAFGLVEKVNEDPTNAIAAVTTVGYTGFIWSPPLLGYVAQHVDLRAAMAVIVIATVGIVGAGFLTPRRSTSRPTPRG